MVGSARGKVGLQPAEFPAELPGQEELLAGTVLDHPAIPEHFHRVENLAEASHVRDPTGRRRSVDPDPAGAAQVGLDPRVGAIVAHGDGLAQAVPFATQKPIHVAGGHATQAQQHGGRRGEVLAVAGRLVKKEVLQWVGDAGVALEVGGVPVGGL